MRQFIKTLRGIIVGTVRTTKGVVNKVRRGRTSPKTSPKTSRPSGQSYAKTGFTTGLGLGLGASVSNLVGSGINFLKNNSSWVFVAFAIYLATKD
tara:strand:+ start:701 stop:985 length:285 start_codon:yes stop_codon:yes gene_type:complete